MPDRHDRQSRPSRLDFFPTREDQRRVRPVQVRLTTRPCTPRHVPAAFGHDCACK